MSYLVNPYMVSASGGVLLFDENYEDSSPWTFVNTQFTVDAGGNGLLKGTAVPDNSLAQAYRDIGFSLPSTYTLKVEYKCTSTTNNIYWFSITENSTQLNSQAKGVLLRTDTASNMCIATVTSGSFTQSSYDTSFAKDVQYYIKIVNDDTNISLSVFTNSDYETGQVGSTLSVTDPNFTTLDTLQHCGRTDGGGGTNYGEINNVSIFEP